jgi:multidrug efflux pump subunit AcrA (membrane-fusion protein)
MTRENGPGGYADAVAEAQQSIREARLADPDEHFPYNREAAERGNPDGVRVLAGVAAATERYVRAQQAYLENPGDATRDDYRATAEALVSARNEHRSNQMLVGPVAATTETREG